MATVIGANAAEWKLRELARRAGRKYEPDEPKNPFENMSKKELLTQKALIDAALGEEDEEE
ncbi:hypothetical protein UFOVP42_49 [uncultured Caudovirales phage]|uniref:Uncharacterized protein n=1 Tax=uncultured Caudovirales phage TaxID=2100421 RepID=A0A6J5KQ42_9CAUD|nr:hypothetical protein UFOVP42_49 [uncultured Caudovirales phage]